MTPFDNWNQPGFKFGRVTQPASKTTALSSLPALTGHKRKDSNDLFLAELTAIRESPESETGSWATQQSMSRMAAFAPSSQEQVNMRPLVPYYAVSPQMNPPIPSGLGGCNEDESYHLQSISSLNLGSTDDSQEEPKVAWAVDRVKVNAIYPPRLLPDPEGMQSRYAITRPARAVNSSMTQTHTYQAPPHIRLEYSAQSFTPSAQPFQPYNIPSPTATATSSVASQDLDSVITTIFGKRLQHNGVVFKPSRAVLEKNSGLVNDHGSYARGGNLGAFAHEDMSYKGSTMRGNNQDQNIPDSENCALWIEGLPRKAGLRDVLAAISNIGKVYSSHLNPASGKHPTNACKLVFFDANAAQRLLCIGQSAKGLRVHGARLQVRYNRHKYQRHCKPYECRVVRVTGHPSVVNREVLETYIGTLMVADILEVYPTEALFSNFGFVELEMQFGSVLAQAAAFKLAVELEPAFRGLIKVTWGVDPCE